MLINEFIDKYQNDIKRYVRTIARDESEASDIVQEVFLKAMLNFGKISDLPDYKQKSWLFTVSKNIMIDIRRKESKLKYFDDDTWLIPENLGFPAFAPASFFEFMDMIKILPENLKDVIIKRYWMGMTSAQISKMYNIPAGTVRYRLHNALTILKSIYNSKG